jgi:hypothetical protein
MSTPDDDRRDHRGSAFIAAAILGAAMILSWGGPDEPRSPLASSGDGVVRMDTDSGEMIACNAQRCSRVQPPARARSFGPVTFEIGDDAEKKAPPAPAN